MEINIFLMLFISSVSVLAQTQGPDRDLFIGDFEQFSCTASVEQLKWIYRYKDESTDLKDGDILEDKNFTKEGARSRSSLIKIKQGIRGVSCFDAIHAKEIGDIPVVVNGFKTIEHLSEPSCNESPKIILKRWDQTALNHLWQGHYVTNEIVNIPADVSGFVLRCLSSTKARWVIKSDIKNFVYRTANKGDCYSAILVIKSPQDLSANQEFICKNDQAESTVGIQLAPVRYSNQDSVLDFNKTQECIEYLGSTVFGNKTLAWSTAGTSLLSIGMMVGIVFLKKQLDKQKENNNNNTSIPPP